MGRVFNYKDRYPTPETFDRASDIFQERVNESVNKGLIDGAIIYGSVAVGRQNVRSDFDTVISLTSLKPENQQIAQDIINTIQEECDGLVPIDDIATHSKRALTMGWHDIDRFLGVHLASEDRIVTGNDPIEYIKYHRDNLSAAEIFTSYLSHKKRRLGRTFRTVAPLDVKEGGLQRMLELPCAIGRRAIQAYSEVYPSDQPPLRSVDKQLVSYKARELFEKFGVSEGFDTLVQYDANYNRLLQDAINRQVSQREYEDAIRELHSKLPSSIAWIEQLQEILLPELVPPTFVATP